MPSAYNSSRTIPSDEFGKGGQHTARAPGAASIRDGYAAQADAVDGRLERSAALAAEQADDA